MAKLLTRKELERKIAPSFTPDQTTVLVDVVDTYNALEIERAADTRAIKAGQQALTEEVGVLTDKVGVLTDTVGNLADAQARTEARVESLADAEARTEISMQELAQAQARTEERMERGFGAISDLAKQVGSMVNTFGFSLEDYTAALLPPYIERNFGVSGLALEQAYFPNAGGVTDEIDLAGRGVQAGEAVAVFAEVKTSIGGAEARRLADKLDAVAEASGEAQVLKLIVAMNIHPSAAEAIAGRDVVLLPYRRINRDRTDLAPPATASTVASDLPPTGG